MRFCGRQLQIATVTDGKNGTALVIEPLPPAQQLTISATVGNFNIGDELEGGVSGAKGIVTAGPTVQTINFIPPDTSPVAGTFLVGDAVSGGTSGATGIVQGLTIGSGHINAMVVHLSTGTVFSAVE